MQRTKILVFVVSFLVLFLATSVAFATPVDAPPTVPTLSSEALAVAADAPKSAPGIMYIVVQTPPTP